MACMRPNSTYAMGKGETNTLWIHDAGAVGADSDIKVKDRQVETESVRCEGQEGEKKSSVSILGDRMKG